VRWNLDECDCPPSARALRDALVERLRSWAQNEEMIDQYFTAHGRDCNEAAAALAQGSEDARDAARYRWLKSVDCDVTEIWDRDGCLRTGIDLDAAIDVAMREENSRG